MKELTTPFKLVENLVARYWYLTPWEFRSLNRDKKAELVATYIADNQTKAYYDSERARKMNSNKKA